MSPERITQLMHHYTKTIGLDPFRDTRDGHGKDRHSALKHVVWMCGEVIEFVKTQRMEKANRWIGFIQGTLWCHGVLTIDQMRRDNMPEGKVFNERA